MCGCLWVYAGVYVREGVYVTGYTRELMSTHRKRQERAEAAPAPVPGRCRYISAFILGLSLLYKEHASS